MKQLSNNRMSQLSIDRNENGIAVIMMLKRAKMIAYLLN